MRRFVIPLALVIVAPVLAWTVADAEPPAAPPCDTATTTTEMVDTTTTTSTTTTVPAVEETTTVVETTTTTTEPVAGFRAPDPCAPTTSLAPPETAAPSPTDPGVEAEPDGPAQPGQPVQPSQPDEPTGDEPPAPPAGPATPAVPSGRAPSPVTASPAPASPGRPAAGPTPAATNTPPAVTLPNGGSVPAPPAPSGGAAAPAGPAIAPVPVPVDPGPPAPGPTDVPTGPGAPATAGPAVPAPAVSAEEEDVESAPVVLPPRSVGGRSLAPTGVSDVGVVRPIVFPVAGPVRYANDFGACRAGCRRQHKGNDLIGDRLQPLLAMHDGIVDRLLDHPTAGFGVVIRDAEGWEYHQYHLNNDTPGTDDGLDDGTWRFAGGIVAGARVVAGQVIGWMGDSGNSEGSVPHTHVEIHNPTRQAINPFWSLRAAQRDVNCGLTALPAAVQPAQLTLAVSTDTRFLEDGWSSPATVGALPGIWRALTLTGGRPTSDDVKARMWIAPDGFTPVDVAAVGVGDRRYDDEDCEPPAAGSTSAPTPAVASPTSGATTSGTAVPAGPAAVQPVAPTPIPADLGAILATIRAMETGGNYRTQISSSTASGAYAFLDGSWDGYGGYRRARDAPPAVQDAKAAWLARYVLDKNNGDVTTIPVSWYIGHVPRGAEWDTVPPVGANVLTPRQYQARWMAMYAKVLGQPDTWVTGVETLAPAAQVCRTTLIDLAPPGGLPAYGLTQVGTFVDDGSGRAVPAANDPCDPNRPVPAPPPPADSAAAVALRARSG